MPANLGPEYYGAEKEFQESKSKDEKLRALAKMLSLIPKHKASQTVIGEIRRKMSIIKKDMALDSKKKKSFAKKGFKKEGAAQVCLVGPANAGKSFILNKLCHTHTKSTDLPFETTEPEIGMLDFEGVQIQLVEIPSVYPGFHEKRGDLMGILFTCDMICFVANNYDEVEFTKKEVSTYGKIVITTSSSELESLGERIWKALNMIKIYTKEPGKPPEKKPFALKAGSVIKDLGNAIHKDFVDRFRYAKVLRPKDKIKEIRAGLNFMLKDNDIVEFKIA